MRAIEQKMETGQKKYIVAYRVYFNDYCNIVNFILHVRVEYLLLYFERHINKYTIISTKSFFVINEL